MDILQITVWILEFSLNVRSVLIRLKRVLSKRKENRIQSPEINFIKP